MWRRQVAGPRPEAAGCLATPEPPVMLQVQGPRRKGPWGGAGLQMGWRPSKGTRPAEEQRSCMGPEPQTGRGAAPPVGPESLSNSTGQGGPAGTSPPRGSHRLGGRLA